MTRHEEFLNAKEICQRMKATPSNLFDSEKMVKNQNYVILKMKVRRFLSTKLHCILDGETEIDAIGRLYGPRARELAALLIER